MHDPVIIRARLRELEKSHVRSMIQNENPSLRARNRMNPFRRAMSLSLAFAAGWFLASILL